MDTFITWIYIHKSIFLSIHLEEHELKISKPLWVLKLVWVEVRTFTFYITYSKLFEVLKCCLTNRVEILQPTYHLLDLFYAFILFHLALLTTLPVVQMLG